MQYIRRLRFAALLLALPLASVAWAQGDQQDNDNDKAFEGTVELLWRNVSVEGNEDKYNEDFQGLSGGGRLGNLWINVVNDSGPINYAQVQAQGLGGDPFEYATIRVGAQKKWDLRYNRRKQDYIYNLFNYMDDLDGHSWDTRREIDEFRLKFYPSKAFDVLVGYRQNERSGNSLFMKDVSRDVFRMNTPVDSVRRDFDVGLNWRIGKSVDLVFLQTRRSYENNFVNTTSGDLGLDQGDNTVLNDYVWNQQEESEADLTKLRVHFGSRMVEVNVGYHGTLLGEEEFDTQVATVQSGTAFDATPLNTIGASNTTTKRDLHYAEADIGLYITRFLNLIVEFDTLQWDQASTGTLDLEGGGGSMVNTRWDYSVDTLTGFAEVVPTRRLNLQIGARTIDRKLTREGFDVLGGERDGVYESNGDETLVAAVTWRSRLLRLGADYEDGSVKTPFTQVSPFSTERLRLRAAVMPTPGMKVEATYLDYENTNDFVPMRNSSAKGKMSSLSFSNSSPQWNYFLRYSRQDVDTMAQVNFDNAGFGGNEDGLSLFSTDNEQFRAMVRFDSPSPWGAFVRFWLARSEGGTALTSDTTGPVPNAGLVIDQDLIDAEVGVTYTMKTGIWVGAAYRGFKYDDPGQMIRNANDPLRSLNYNGTIVTLRAGYVFGRPKS